MGRVQNGQAASRWAVVCLLLIATTCGYAAGLGSNEACDVLALESELALETMEGLQATIETMQNRVEEARVQEAGLVALEHVITKSHANVTAGIAVVGAAGGLQVTLEAIRHHADHYQIAVQGCSVLALLLQSASLADTAGKMGAARAVVALMDSHKQALLQEKASWALMNLGAQVHDNKSRIHDEGGVEALLGALKRLPGHAGVQRQASGAITNLAAGHYDNKGRIANAGGLPLLVEGLTKHKTDSSVSEQARADARAPRGRQGESRQMCAALANLGTHDKNPKKASRAGALPAIVKAMLENPKSATLQAHCSRAIASLTWHDEDIKREAREVQAADVCNAALTLHPNDENVQKWAKKALEKFTNPFVDSVFESMLGSPGEH